jgi:hypothetical protein
MKSKNHDISYQISSIKDGSVTCVEVTTEFLQEKINDVKFPFGHGYVVASFLKNIELNEFI